MEPFTFYKRTEADQDERAELANAVCQLLWDEPALDIGKIKRFQEMFDNSIRNFYELIDDSVPLISWVTLYNASEAMDNYGFDEDEYKDAIQRTGNAMQEYYGKKDTIRIIQEKL